MAEIPTKTKAVNFLFVLNAAITNMRLYPPTSGIIQNSVDRMHKVMTETLASTGSLEFAESEKKLLVAGEPLPEKEQQKPQINSFLTTMLDMGIRSLTFQEGITRGEIDGFLQVLARTPEEVNAEGGVLKLIGEYDVSHVQIDEKIYVGIGPEQRLVEGNDDSDVDLARLIMGDGEMTDEVVGKIRSIATHPKWFSRIFESGVRQIIDSTAGQTGKTDLSGAFAGMIDTLDGMTDTNKREINEHIINSMAEMDDAVLATVLTQNLDAVFGDDFFARSVDELDSQRFKKLFSRIREMAETPGRFAGEEAEAIQRVYGLMRETSQGRAIAGASDKSFAGNSANEKFARLKIAINRISRGDAGAFTEAVVTESLPDTFMQLIAGDKQAIVARLIEQMGEALLDEDPEIRRTVAGLMAKIDGQLESTKYLEERISLSKKLADWVKFETAVTREFESVTDQLQNLCKSMIHGGRAGEMEHILEAYQMISAGNLKKNDAIAALAGNMLQNLATEDILDLLLSDAKKNGQEKGKDDIYTLVILGTMTVERLLDRLHDSHNMSERNRIVQAVSQIGKPALAPIAERLKQDGPWYYIRNLVLLIGRLGDEDQLPILAALMRHSDYRVQREVIKSIQAIGGDAAGRVLFDHIDVVDEQLIGYLISVIGALPYPEAAPVFIEMLASRTLGKTKADREEIREKICEALGRMQSEEAVSALEKIVRARGFFGRKSPEKVRSAAARALTNIRRDSARP